jgi:hypothetical protein
MMEQNYSSYNGQEAEIDREGLGTFKGIFLVTCFPQPGPPAGFHYLPIMPSN